MKLYFLFFMMCHLLTLFSIGNGDGGSGASGTGGAGGSGFSGPLGGVLFKLISCFKLTSPAYCSHTLCNNDNENKNCPKQCGLCK